MGFVSSPCRRPLRPQWEWLVIDQGTSTNPRLVSERVGMQVWWGGAVPGSRVCPGFSFSQELVDSPGFMVSHGFEAPQRLVASSWLMASLRFNGVPGPWGDSGAHGVSRVFMAFPGFHGVPGLWGGTAARGAPMWGGGAWFLAQGPRFFPGPLVAMKQSWRSLLWRLGHRSLFLVPSRRWLQSSPTVLPFGLELFIKALWAHTTSRCWAWPLGRAQSALCRLTFQQRCGGVVPGGSHSFF